MDGDRSAPQGRKDQEVHPEIGRRDGAGGQGWEDRRSRDDASGRREESDGRREGSRSGKDESRSGRDESRPGKDESRSGRSREEGRGRQGSKREEKREEKGSSSSRRRSRSKEKERARSKERESSPYSKALESWRKFKQAEKVALDQVLNSIRLLFVFVQAQ